MITQKDIAIQRKVTRISNLIVAHLKDAITPRQKNELMNWVNASEHNKQCFEKWNDPEYMQKALAESELIDSENIFKKTMQKIEAFKS